MSYTLASLKKAIVETLPRGEEIISSMGLPRAVEEASLHFFLRGETAGDRVLAIRAALSDLHNTGCFQSHLVEGSEDRVEIGGDKDSKSIDDRVVDLMKQASAALISLAGDKERCEAYASFVERVKAANAYIVSPALTELIDDHDIAMLALEKHIDSIKKQNIQANNKTFSE